MARFGITLPADQQLAISFNDRDVAVTPNGTHVVYTAGAESQLVVRALDRLDLMPLAGTTDARAPFVSPDAQWVGFFDRLDEGLTTGPVVGGSLKKVPIGGGPPIVIAPLSGGSRGATWGADDSIIFATSDTATGLLRVAARGGEPEVLTRPDQTTDERDHHFPSLLPQDRGVVFTVVARGGQRRVAVLDLKTGKSKTEIREGSQARYLESGHLVYEDGGALWAVRFDLTTMEIVGEPLPMLERVTWGFGTANLAFSRNGMLVYAPSAGAGEDRSLVWVDRQGAASRIASPQDGYVLPRLSPDGTRVAVNVQGGGNQWRIWDFALQKFTFLPAGPEPFGFFSVWSPDSRYLFVGADNVFRRAVDGTGRYEQLTDSRPDRQRRAVAVSPDGKRLILEQLMPGASYDLMMLSLDNGSLTNAAAANRTSPLLATPSDERNAAFSPDGRWIAYESNRSGQFQICMRPFPNVEDAEHQISIAGGRTPLFSPDGRELFFVTGSALMSAAVQFEPAFRAGNPAKLFDGHSLILDARLITNTGRTYEVSRDGKRFLMLKDEAGATSQSGQPGIIVVQNWFEELKARLRGVARSGHVYVRESPP